MTTIRNPVLFGLKVSFNFSDIESKTSALRNLGLDIRDLNVIRGIADNNVSKVDLQNISGLDVNLTRYLDRLQSDTARYNGLVSDLAGYQYITKGNLEAFGPVSGGAIRYKYIPNDGGINQNADNLKYGDISTSRVSSWSSATSDETNTQQAISYGGSVQVKGKLMLGQNVNFDPQSSECLLNVLDTPEPIRFATEIPTDIIEIKFNGTEQYMYAMRGIPFIFTTAFKKIAMDFTYVPFTASGETQRPIYTFTATDDSEPEIYSKPSANAAFISRLRFNSQSYKERDIRVYFPPGNITKIVGNKINLRYLPAAKFLALQSISITSNLLDEMPDWRTINYVYDKGDPQDINTPLEYQQSLSNGPGSDYNEPGQSLTVMNVNKNKFYLSEDEDQVRFGTNVVERLPSRLTSLNVQGCYRENTEFLTADKSLVIMKENWTVAEFSTIKCDPKATQTYPLNSLLPNPTTGTGNPNTDDLTIKGIFYDKITFDGFSYVYIDDPEIKINGTDVDGSEIEAAYPELLGKMGIFQPLDLRTRCPNLQTFNITASGSQKIYGTSDTKRPDFNNPFTQLNNNGELMPRVNIKKIRSYTVKSNGFTRVADEFRFPENYLIGEETSDLRNIDLYDNDSLSQRMNFGPMPEIRTINIGDTSMEIPDGLTGKPELTTVSCSYTRFPNRSETAQFNATTGEGNPSNVNNHFFNTKNPTDFNQYVFKDCEKLKSFGMYASRMDGFFPKLIGNGSLTSIDLRDTNIEGGRPESSTENGGEIGRRYIMWNDTFEEAPNITSIRIKSGVLGRNIGEYTPGPIVNGQVTAGTYSGAAFEGATFNLPLLTTLEILCPQKRIRGEFFDPSQAPSLTKLVSYSTGWGLDITDPSDPSVILGTTFPSFSGNPNINYVDLTDNKFSGNVALSNLNNLKEFYVGENELDAITTFENLPNLENITVANNPNLGPDFPDFSDLAENPRVRTINFNNCAFINYTPGSLATSTRLKTLDLSNNFFTRDDIDDILQDLKTNYQAAQRGGVTVNLKGNAAPSNTTIQIPTITISQVESQSITVNQSQFLDNGTTTTTTTTEPGPDGILGTEDDVTTTTTTFTPNPLPAQYIFGPNDPNDPSHEIQVDLRDDLDGTTSEGDQYETRVFLDGVQLNSETIDINYATDTITFLGNTPGNVTQYPPHGSVLKIEIWKTKYGFRTEIVGGITLVNFLNSVGWFVRV